MPRKKKSNLTTKKATGLYHARQKAQSTKDDIEYENLIENDSSGDEEVVKVSKSRASKSRISKADRALKSSLKD